MGKDTGSALKWIVSILNKNNITFQIGGGFAARLHGAERDLADIDIAVPTDQLEILAKETKKYTTYELKRYTDENWNVIGMTVEYKGQEIDLVGAQGKTFFNKEKQEWIPMENDFSSSVYKEIYGISIPVMAKDKLIAYKKLLGREVDLLDLKFLER